MSRKTLAVARAGKKDEFYTLYEDVKFELDHYIDCFRDKVIYCPCDTSDSAFVKYFIDLESKGLIKELIYTSIADGVDCLGQGAIDGYRHCDIIVTNPPFSIFRPFIELLSSLNKDFILWGNNNAITFRIIAKLLKNDKISLGYIHNKTCTFEVPYDYEGKSFVDDGKRYCNVPAISVFTTFNTHHRELVLTRKYDQSAYKKYDNFDAINVNKCKDIPHDYDGPIGVPITYLGYYDNSKYKILGVFNNFVPDVENGILSGDYVESCLTHGPVVDGNPVYVRLIIQKR